MCMWDRDGHVPCSGLVIIHGRQDDQDSVHLVQVTSQLRTLETYFVESPLTHKQWLSA